MTIMNRILLIDDHVAIRRGLRDLLFMLDPSLQIGEACDSAQALQLACAEEWQIAIVDLNLPGRGGLDLVSDLKRLKKTLHVLVYTMHSEAQFGVRCMQAGASGYITKDSSVEELEAAITALLSGQPHITPRMACALAAALSQPGTHIKLSNREHDVLRRLSLGHGVNEIARELNLSPQTVSTHRMRLMRKLCLHTNAELVRYCIEHGLIGPGM